MIEPLPIDRWRDGDLSCHCTHCDACGHLFRTEDIRMHLEQAHLGGRVAHTEHRKLGCKLLVMLAAGLHDERLEAWVKTELRLRDVEDYINQPRRMLR